MNNRLKGTGAALVTPFHPDGSIDFGCLAKLVENLIANGVDYLVTTCTTSETPTLTEEEKDEIVACVVKANAGRVAIVRGLGGPNTKEIAEQLRTKDFTGVDAILSVTPFYNRPNQEGIYQHYKILASCTPLPLILYNVPGRTGCNIEADTTLRIANDFPNIVAVKEASGNMNQIMKVIAHKPAEFSVLSGDDAITLPLLAAGVDGVISVVANAFPKEVSDMVRLARRNQFDEARKIHLRLLDFTQACFKEGSPAGIKALLALQGKMDHTLRLPLVPVSQELSAHFAKLLSDFQ